MRRITGFELRGICCANGIIKARKIIASVKGAGKVSIDLANNVAEVAGEADPQAVISALREAGFDAALPDSGDV